MIIKKFIGKTEEEAVAAARKELGEGCVIMNVRVLKKKGLSALFSAKQIEVTVALEEDHGRIVPKESSARTLVAEPKLSPMREDADAQNANTESLEKKLDSLQVLLESQMRKAEEEKAAAEKAKQEAHEAADGNEEAAEESDELSEQDKFLRLLYNIMLDNEVDEKYANQMLEEIDKNKKANMPIDYILANVYQKMILKFGKPEGIVPAEKGPKIVLFIGPTGVGKTTTIAKLASNFSMDEKNKVALLTADTFRIAAAEQLRTYANILEVPFRVIYTIDELERAITDFAEYDYIFVDTTGHSHQNNEQLQKMKDLLDSLKGTVEYQVFLVVSATTKYPDLLMITETYQKIVDYQLIFTKLDETDRLGNLLNVKLGTGTNIAYTAYGQNVPDDIEMFHPQKTVKQLLGGKI